LGTSKDDWRERERERERERGRQTDRERENCNCIYVQAESAGVLSIASAGVLSVPHSVRMHDYNINRLAAPDVNKK
jgi:hypothetical protein